jgi:hypothetical protein
MAEHHQSARASLVRMQRMHALVCTNLPTLSLYVMRACRPPGHGGVPGLLRPVPRQRPGAPRRGRARGFCQLPHVRTDGRSTMLTEPQRRVGTGRTMQAWQRLHRWPPLMCVRLCMRLGLADPGQWQVRAAVVALAPPCSHQRAAVRQSRTCRRWASRRVGHEPGCAWGAEPGGRAGEACAEPDQGTRETGS